MDRWSAGGRAPGPGASSLSPGRGVRGYQDDYSILTAPPSADGATGTEASAAVLSVEPPGGGQAKGCWAHGQRGEAADQAVRADDGPADRRHGRHRPRWHQAAPGPGDAGAVRGHTGDQGPAGGPA